MVEYSEAWIDGRKQERVFWGSNESKLSPDSGLHFQRECSNVEEIEGQYEGLGVGGHPEWASETGKYTG